MAGAQRTLTSAPTASSTRTPSSHSASTVIISCAAHTHAVRSHDKRSTRASRQRAGVRPVVGSARLTSAPAAIRVCRASVRPEHHSEQKRNTRCELRTKQHCPHERRQAQIGIARIERRCRHIGPHRDLAAERSRAQCVGLHCMYTASARFSCRQTAWRHAPTRSGRNTPSAQRSSSTG
jgi:hypothetical protein